MNRWIRLPQPAYVLEKIERDRLNRIHLKEAAADCPCPLHAGSAGLHARLDRKRREQEERNGPPPF